MATVKTGKTKKRAAYNLDDIPVAVECDNLLLVTPRATSREPDWATKAPFRVAFGKGDSPTLCPVWGDVLPYKSITVIVDKADLASASDACEYVHGGGSVRKTRNLPDGKVAIRSDYQCW